MKIVLDANIINNETFNIFDKYEIIKLVKRNKLSFFISDMLIGERFYELNLYNKNLYKSLLNLTLMYADSRMFAPIGEILHKEMCKKEDVASTGFCKCRKQIL